MSDSSLFRPEAINSGQSLVFGEVRITTPRLLRNLLAIISLIAGTLVVISLFAQYLTKTTVIGQLIPDQGMVRLYTPEKGVVKSILTQEGAHVAKGERLISITADTMILDAESRSAKLAELNRSAIDNIDDLLKSRALELELEKEGLAGEIEALTRGLEIAYTMRSSQEKRIALERERLRDIESLRKTGLASENEVRSQEAILLEQLQDQAIVVADITNLKGQIKRLQNRLDSVGVDATADFAEFAIRKVGLQQDQTTSDSAVEYFIESPVASTVASILVRPSQFVDDTQAIIVLVPNGSELIAELYAPTRSVGMIETGQEVIIKYDAFPTRTFGSIIGTVRSVSNIVLTERDIGADLEGQRHAFVVKVQLSSQSVLRNGVEVDLQPGMRVSATINLEKRTIAEWLFSRVFRNQ